MLFHGCRCNNWVTFNVWNIMSFVQYYLFMFTNISAVTICFIPPAVIRLQGRCGTKELPRYELCKQTRRRSNYLLYKYWYIVTSIKGCLLGCTCTAQDIPHADAHLPFSSHLRCCDQFWSSDHFPFFYKGSVLV